MHGLLLQIYGLSPSVARSLRSNGEGPLGETLTRTKSPSLSLRGMRRMFSGAILKGKSQQSHKDGNAHSNKRVAMAIGVCYSYTDRCLVVT